MEFQIRESLESDSKAIRSVVLAAFGPEEGEEIADLVAELDLDPTAEPRLSLVATNEETIIGHILFTAVKIEADPNQTPCSILAPLAIHPEYQKQGVGGLLIHEGLKQLQESGVDLVFVLGHPSYYPKFGFTPSGYRGLDAPYPILPKNAEAWMVQELRPGILGSVRGTLICATALDDARYWVE
ncbi:MAG: N-acetyltransferase [Planctomycetota bacterium]|nr:MAG: N-acetyltransferase [Planctomycetota bacterium]